MTAGATVFPKSADDPLYSIDMNNWARIHKKVFTDATVYTQANNTWTDKKTFTLSAPLGSVILSILFKVEIKTTGDVCQVGLALDGTNLTKTYLTSGGLTQSNSEGSFLWDATQAETIRTSQTGYVERGLSTTPAVEVLDTSTSIIVSLRNNATSTSSLKNISVTVLYTRAFTDDDA